MDAKQRIEAFQKEYIALTEKYDVDFASFPQYGQISNGAFVTMIATQLIDKKALPKPSPMTKDGKIIKE